MSVTARLRTLLKHASPGFAIGRSLSCLHVRVRTGDASAVRFAPIGMGTEPRAAAESSARAKSMLHLLGGHVLARLRVRAFRNRVGLPSLARRAEAAAAQRHFEDGIPGCFASFLVPIRRRPRPAPTAGVV